MLFAALPLVSALFPLARAADPVAEPPWTAGRVWPEDAAQPPALVEHLPDAPAELGAHAALHNTNLDGCWRQHAAHSGDLDAWFCADVKVGKKGTAKAKVVALSDDRPGLSTCIEATLSAWAGPPKVPARARVCRAVMTNLSDHAKTVWASDPWATVQDAGKLRSEPVRHTIEVGRPAIEKAERLERDPATGDLVRVPDPVALRDRATTTARRLVTGHIDVVEGCWRDHGQWRLPPSDDPLLGFTLEVVVGEAGAEAVVAGRAAPRTHASVADCVAARLDPELPSNEGSHVLQVPVSIQP